MRYYKIIRIADIIFRLEVMFNELVKFVHINVSKKLGGEIPYRRAFQPFVAEFRRKTAENNFYKPHRIWVFDSPIDNAEHYFMINGRKELPDITFEHEAFPMRLEHFLGKGRETLYTLVRSLADSCGIRIGDKGRLKDGINVFENRVMDDAISNFGFMNMAYLRIANIKTDILSVFVSFILKIAVEAKEIIFKSQFKLLNISLCALSLFKPIPRFQ